MLSQIDLKLNPTADDQPVMDASAHSPVVKGDSAKSLSEKLTALTLPRTAARRDQGLEEAFSTARSGASIGSGSAHSSLSESSESKRDPRTALTRWQKLKQASLGALPGRPISRSTGTSKSSADSKIHGGTSELRDAALDAFFQRERAAVADIGGEPGIAPRMRTSTAEQLDQEPEPRLPPMSWAAVPQRSGPTRRKPVRRHSAGSLDAAFKDDHDDQLKVSSAQRALKLFLELESAKPLKHLAREALASGSKKGNAAAGGSSGKEERSLRRIQVTRPREEDAFRLGIASADVDDHSRIGSRSACREEESANGWPPTEGHDGESFDNDEGHVATKGVRVHVNGLFCLFRSRK